MNINHIFDSEKVRKMGNLGNDISEGSSLCYEQNQCAGEWTAPLNKSIKREHFKLPTRDEVTAQFTNAKVFTKLDASNGF